MVAEVIPMTHASPTARSAAAPFARRGPALLVAVALTLATGVALLRAESLVADTWPAADPAVANEAVVRRYYAAANTAIATGETDELEAVVAADLDLSSDLSEAAAGDGREVLIGRFLAAHAAQPNLRLAVRDVVADEDDVVARVAVEGASPGVPPAVRLSRFAEDWLDGFRVRRGKVAAAWGATVGLGVPTAVLSAELNNPWAEPFIGLTRLTLPPGAQLPILVGPGPMVVMPEARTLRVRIDGVGRLTRAAAAGAPTPASTERGGPFSLGPGDELAVGAGVSFDLRNPGDEPTVVLVAAAFPAAAFDPVTIDGAGTVPRPLAVAIFEREGELAEAGGDHPEGLSLSWEPLIVRKAPVPADRLRLSLERVVVAPGGVIPAFRPGRAMLVAVEQGAAVADVERSLDDVVRPPIVLLADGGATLLQEDVAGIRNGGDEPAVVLALTIEPEGA